MRYLFIIMRYSISKSHKCRLIMLNSIIVLMKSLRDLNLKNLDEYMSTQHAFVVWVF